MDSKLRELLQQYEDLSDLPDTSATEIDYKLHRMQQITNKIIARCLYLKSLEEKQTNPLMEHYYGR